jgi:hypothetical protein
MIILNDNDLRSIIDIHFYDNFSTPISIKSLSLSLTFNQTVYHTRASLLGILITLVNNFHFNLVLMFVCSVK